MSKIYKYVLSFFKFFEIAQDDISFLKYFLDLQLSKPGD